ncbi:UNVERIFIED_CONTAM: hypothetical protein RMT77_019609 [Armadillidium vulgare]
MEIERFKSHITDENINKGHDGEDFELVLGKFFLHRLINQNIKNFKLTREKKGCGKFDDLAFVYDSNDGEEKYCLVQLKCKSDEKGYKIGYKDLTTNPSSYFLLPYYFDHFIEFLKFVDNDKDLKGAELHELIICTNVGIEDSIEPISKTSLQNPGLFLNSGNLYKLSINDLQKRKEIFHDQFLSDRKRLSRELVLCVMLKKSVNIQSMIHDQTFSLIKIFYKMLIEDVIKVSSKKFRESFLSEKLEESNQELYGFREDFFDSLIEFYERFKNEDSESLKTLIDFGRFKNVTDQNSKVNTLKLLLKRFKTDKEEIVKFLKSREVIFTGIPNEPLETSGQIYPSNVADTYTDKKIVLFLDLLTFAVNQVKNEKIINDEINNLPIYKGFSIYMKNWYYKGASSSSDFPKSKVNYRKWITKQNLLEDLNQSIILFQNENVHFCDIYAASDTITPEVLMHAFSENISLSIGKPIEKEHTKFYIDRTLTQSNKVNNNIFIEINNCFIIVTLEKKLDVSHLQTQYFSDIEMKDLKYFDSKHPFYFTYKKFSSDYIFEFHNKNRDIIKDKELHWLSFIGNDLKYESSYPLSSNFLKQYCKADKHFNELELMENQKYIIATGDPGIGKTALLERASNILKNTNKSTISWIIKISLNECQKIFKNFSSLNTIEIVATFFAECENCKDEFSKNLIKHFLLYESRLIALFDGFDEVHEPRDRKKIIELLTFLKSETVVKQIWISTRPHYAYELEKALGVVAFEIEDITEEEQIKLVTEHWKILHNTSILFTLFEENSRNLIRSFNRGINNQDRKFLGIPLHTFMIAVAFEEEAKNEAPSYPEKIGLVRLYEYFFKRKYDIFFAEKVETPEIFKHNVINVYEIQYQKFALENGGVISSEDAELLASTVSCKYDFENLKRIGLIHESGNELQFIHRTFAEYLIADLLSFNLETYTKDISEIVKNILLEKGNAFILYIFDTKLTENSEKYKIYNSIMLREIDSLYELSDDYLGMSDYLGRGCFYYALQYRQFPILSYLISRDAQIHFERFFIACIFSFRTKFYHKALLHKNSSDEKILKDIQSLNKSYTELFEYILGLDENTVPKVLVATFVLTYEANLKHWDIILKLIHKFNENIYVYEILELCLYRAKILKAPIEVPLLFIFKSADSVVLKEGEESRFDHLKQNAYCNILNGLLNCEKNHLNSIILNYGYVVAKLSNCFDLLVEIFYKLHGLDRLYPFMSHITLVSEYINYIKIKSENFTLLSKFLFENGASLPYFDNEMCFSRNKELPQRSRSIGDVDYSCIYFMFPFEIKWVYPIRRLSSLKVEGEKAIFLNDLISVIGKYMFICNYDESTTVYEAIQLIIKLILTSNEGVQLLHLIRKFHTSVENNNIEGVAFLFAEAKRRNWPKAISMAKNKDQNNAKEMLIKLDQRVSRELNSMKEELRLSAKSSTAK